MDLRDDAEVLRERLLEALEAAQRNHDTAERNLLAAKQVLVQARVALDQARAALRDSAPPGRVPGSRGAAPPPVYHFACGHDGERVIEAGNTRVINLCPDCHERARHGALNFYQLRGLMVPRQ